ncbi:MAG: N-acetylmuramoyl-L-alanine amidase family protein [Candidatus Eiseniibacteriota bacterium]
MSREKSPRAAACLAAVIAVIAVTAASVSLGAVGTNSSGTPSAGSGVTLTSLRSWSAPTNTRLVFDFSAPVTLAGPDSGLSRVIALSTPGERVALGAGVPASLAVNDSAVDSVRIDVQSNVTYFHLAFADTTNFHVFTLPAEAGKPYRVVIDVERPGADAREARRLAGIAAAKKARRTLLVAVDAGHGGEDTGARGPEGVLEKNVTLLVARALVDEINLLPGMQGVLVRNGDYFVPLHERYLIAERMKADLFISIHCNSSRRRGAGSGTEVYFLSLTGASDQADADLAATENAADLVGGVPAQSDNSLVDILYDVKRSAALEKSQLLAESLLDHVAVDHRLESRGVKQASFAVLKSCEFPSALVETAFINNPIEARLLRQTSFQHEMGRQLASGVSEYFSRAGMMPGTPADSDSRTAR